LLLVCIFEGIQRDVHRGNRATDLQV
jgi:hypothetical protein